MAKTAALAEAKAKGWNRCVSDWKRLTPAFTEPDLILSCLLAAVHRSISPFYVLFSETAFSRRVSPFVSRGDPVWAISRRLMLTVRTVSLVESFMKEGDF